MRGIISGAISFGAIYFIPVTGKIIESLIGSLPVTLGAQGIDMAVVKLGVAIGLWLMLYLLFGAGSKK